MRQRALIIVDKRRARRNSWRIRLSHYRETASMRRWITFAGTLCLLVGFGAGARAGDKPQLDLADPELPLYELRANDRRVVGLTLEGAWQQPAKSGSHHYVNVLFPNGQSYSMRVDEHPVAVRKLVTESKNGRLT